MSIQKDRTGSSLRALVGIVPVQLCGASGDLQLFGDGLVAVAPKHKVDDSDLSRGGPPENACWRTEFTSPPRALVEMMAVSSVWRCSSDASRGVRPDTVAKSPQRTARTCVQHLQVGRAPTTGQADEPISSIRLPESSEMHGSTSWDAAKSDGKNSSDAISDMRHKPSCTSLVHAP